MPNNAINSNSEKRPTLVASLFTSGYDRYPAANYPIGSTTKGEYHAATNTRDIEI